MQLPDSLAGLAWLPGTELPTFYTAGRQGLLQWQLEPEELTSSAVHMPAGLRGVALTAVAACSEAEDESDAGDSGSSWSRGAQRSAGSAAVVAGDGSGRVWRLQLDPTGQDVQSSLLLAELQGQSVSWLQAAGQLVAAGTAGGTLLLLEEEGWSGKDAGWRMLRCEQLDGAVGSMQLDATSRTASAATACGTLWRVGPGGAPQVLLCGQQHSMRGWHLAPGAAWKDAPAAAAVASASGVAIWQPVSEHQGGSHGSKKGALVRAFARLSTAKCTALVHPSVCRARRAAGGGRRWSSSRCQQTPPMQPWLTTAAAVPLPTKTAPSACLTRQPPACGGRWRGQRTRGAWRRWRWCSACAAARSWWRTGRCAGNPSCHAWLASSLSAPHV